ncbi:hypothetical protein KK420_10835 [Clostridioides difficile]|nr:hypothetical protein [Clostridioides difficile]
MKSNSVQKIPLNKRVDMYQSYLYGRQKILQRSYYIKVDGREIIGFSPETVVEVDREKMYILFHLQEQGHYVKT